MKRTLRYATFAIAALGSMIVGQSAHAASLTYATDVVAEDDYAVVSGKRGDTTHALGEYYQGGYQAPEDEFYSLGKGGWAIFDFGIEFSGSVKVWETTWGNKTNQNQYDERIEVYFGNSLNPDGEWDAVGEIWNIRDGAFQGGYELTTDSDEVYRYVKLVDLSKTPDGFDVEAIAVRGIESTQSVPEPTSLVALLGLAAFGTGSSLLKRRR